MGNLSKEEKSEHDLGLSVKHYNQRTGTDPLEGGDSRRKEHFSEILAGRLYLTFRRGVDKGSKKERTKISTGIRS